MLTLFSVISFAMADKATKKKEPYVEEESRENGEEEAKTFSLAANSLSLLPSRLLSEDPNAKTRSSQPFLLEGFQSCSCTNTAAFTETEYQGTTTVSLQNYLQLSKGQLYWLKMRTSFGIHQNSKEMLRLPSAAHRTSSKCSK